ncbi:hypothetical protein PM082_020144 [Marasmius tenuissimus]|nr:hypothetical protein PM082_020144 [Marasmius tenuissimus]
MAPQVPFDDIIHVDEFDRTFRVNKEGAVAESTPQISLEDQLRKLDGEIEELIQRADPFNAGPNFDYGGIEVTTPVMHYPQEFSTGELSNNGRKRTLSFGGYHSMEDDASQKRMRRDNGNENVGQSTWLVSQTSQMDRNALYDTTLRHHTQVTNASPTIPPFGYGFQLPLSSNAIIPSFDHYKRDERPLTAREQETLEGLANRKNKNPSSAYATSSSAQQTAFWTTTTTTTRTTSASTSATEAATATYIAQMILAQGSAVASPTLTSTTAPGFTSSANVNFVNYTTPSATIQPPPPPPSNVPRRTCLYPVLRDGREVPCGSMVSRDEVNDHRHRWHPEVKEGTRCQWPGCKSSDQSLPRHWRTHHFKYV